MKREASKWWRSLLNGDRDEGSIRVEVFTTMRWLDDLKNRIRTLNQWIAGMGAVFLIPLMLITAAEVISRDLFNRSIPGVIEVSEYLLAIFILLGLAFVQQVKAHVRVSLIASRLPHCAQFALQLVTALVSLFIFSILAWQGWVVGIEERTVSDLLRIPQYPFRLLVAVAAFLVCLELLMDVEDSVRKLVGRSS